MPYRRDSGRKVRDYTVKDSDNSVDIARYLARSTATTSTQESSQ